MKNTLGLSTGPDEFILNSKEGRKIPVEITTIPVKIKNKVVVLGIARDISERKQAEESLSETISLLQATLESTTDGILVVDLKGRIIDYNSKFIEVWEMPESIITEGKTKDLVAPENAEIAMKHIVGKLSDPQQFISKVQSLYHKPEAESFDVLNFKDGRIIERFSKPQYLNDAPVGRVWSFRDVTDRKKVEDELRIALEKATESDRLKSAFLATMSHELRTPLNAIIGFSDIIDDSMSVPEIIQYNKTINDSGNHLLTIVEELFDLSLIETGVINIKKEDHNLSSLLQNVHQIIKSEQQKIKKDHLDLTQITPPESRNLVVYTDASKLKQILLNLLKNSLRFTIAGSINYGFKVDTKEGEKRLLFYVEDTGIGISKDEQEYIFEIFRQVDDKTTKTYGGTGIGLSICKKLVCVLDGEIWVESNIGKGSTFYFTIPYQERDKDIPSDEVISKAFKRNSKEFDTKTILVVEDDNSSYDYLNVILEMQGATVLRAVNGEKAIIYCTEDSTIDLVLMDINMPVMDGFVATKAIKKIKPNLPIIAQTAYAISGDKEMALEAGCDDYISKPISKEKLKKILEKFLK